MKRMSLLLLLALPALAQSTCKYYFYSELQEYEIRSTNVVLHRNEPSFRWAYLTGKRIKYTEMVEVTEPSTAVPFSDFPDIHLVGKSCKWGK